jgi:hypothetical protein
VDMSRQQHRSSRQLKSQQQQQRDGVTLHEKEESRRGKERERW